MTKLYKLTDDRDRTPGGTQWGEGISHTASGYGNLCDPGWFLVYTDPLLAVLLSPLHDADEGVDFSNPHLWEAEGEIRKTDELRTGELRTGCLTLTTLRRVPVPNVTPEQRVRFAILCALEVCCDESFRAWAARWLSGGDRSARAAKDLFAARAAQAPTWKAQLAWEAASSAARAALSADHQSFVSEEFDSAAAASAATLARRGTFDVGAWVQEAKGEEDMERRRAQAVQYISENVEPPLDLAAIAHRATNGPSPESDLAKSNAQARLDSKSIPSRPHTAIRGWRFRICLGRTKREPL